jgi:O-antigen ligase
VDLKTEELNPRVSFFIEINLLLIIFTALFLRGAVADCYWYPVGIWIIIIFCFSILAWDRGYIAAPKLMGLEPLLLAWLFFIIASGLFSGHHWESMLALERLFSGLIFLYLMVWNFSDRRREKIMVWALFAFPVAICLPGLVFFLSKRNLFFPFVNEFAQFCGTFVNHNNFAGLIMLGFFLGVGLLMAIQKRGAEFRSELWARWALLSIPLVVLLVSLQLSMSRSGWVALFAAGAGLLVWLGFSSDRKKFRTYFAVTLLVLVLGVVISLVLGKSLIKARMLTLNDFFKDPASGLTLTGRKLIWKSTLGMIKDHPVLGVGPGNYWLEYPHYRTPGDFFGEHHAHNDLLQLAAESGIPSAALMVLLFIAGFRIWRQNYRREMTRFQHRVSIGIVFGMLAFLVQDQGDFHFYIPGLAYYFLALASFLLKPRKNRHD